MTSSGVVKEKHTHMLNFRLICDIVVKKNVLTHTRRRFRSGIELTNWSKHILFKMLLFYLHFLRMWPAPRHPNIRIFATYLPTKKMQRTKPFESESLIGKFQVVWAVALPFNFFGSFYSFSFVFPLALSFLITAFWISTLTCRFNSSLLK